MDRRSPAVSPSVVAQIFMIQKASVTCATLFMLSCMCWFLMARLGDGVARHHQHRRGRDDATACLFGMVRRHLLEWGQAVLVSAALDAVLEDLAGLGVHA